MTENTRPLLRGPWQRWLALAASVALMASLYAPILTIMVRGWNREDYNHCYFVPFVALYLLWEKRKELAALPSRASWWGLPVVCLGLFFYWVGELGGEYLTLYISCWLVLVGLCWVHLGWRKLRLVAFPLLLLATLFPLPNFLYQQFSLKLQLISSQLGVGLIRLFGMPAYIEGNVIDLGFSRLQVVDACSGLRYIFPLLVLGLILAYFFRAAWWKRLLLVAVIIPLSIALNSGRIAFAAFSQRWWGPAVAEGFLHDFSGWVIFMVSLAILLLFQWVLSKLPGAAPPRAETIDGPPPPAAADIAGEAISASPALPSPAASGLLLSWVPVALMGATLLAAQNIDFRERVPILQPLSRFPLVVADWVGTPQSMEAEIIRELDLNDYTIVDYRDPSGRTLNLYVAYYETQRKGESIHSPETCLLGGGWVFTQKGPHTLRLKGNPHDAITVNRVVMEKPGARTLVYFWFPQRGRILTTIIQLKIFNFWDALTQQRTDGSLVRVTTPFLAGENPDQPDARLEAFVREAAPLLSGFLPGRSLKQ